MLEGKLLKGEYNGWKNYYTWNLNLWLTNDEVTYTHYRELAETTTFENFKAELENFVLDGGASDIHKESKELVEKDIIDYRAIYKGLLE